MSEVDSNIEVIRRHHTMLNAGDVEAALPAIAEDCRNHGLPGGRQRFEAVLRDIQGTFPDWNVEILDAIGVDDDVVIRANVSGTHRGVGRLPVNGALLVGVPPTGKSFVVQHIHWYRMKGGQIIDHRASRDDLGMLQQLGIVPGLTARSDLPPEARTDPRS
ncbi:MAG: hypothetical protein JWR83_1903 [Aeromicrobium sp.]|nr:hypothetical protein [Aeromicrobium sp.]